MSDQTKNGKRVLPAGDKRRIYDARNAWRKMTPEQRMEFVEWCRKFNDGEVT